MQLQDDAVRVLRDNLRTATSKVIAVGAIALGWLGPYKAADYLGVEKIRYRLLAVAGFYLVGGIAIIILFLARSLHQAYERLGPGVPSHKALAELAGKFFGVEKKIVTDECTVYADGSSLSIVDITLFAHATQVRQIEHTSTTPNAPDGEVGNLEISAEPYNQEGVLINAEILRATPKECYWTVNFVPELRKNKTVQYRYRMKSLPRSFATTLEEMRSRGLEQEYFSQTISYPTAMLRFRVTFHSAICPQSIDYDVWLGKGGVQHKAEYIRIVQQSLFSTDRDADNRVFGELTVPYPIQGLRYVITWKPPKAKGAAEAAPDFS